VKGYQAVIMVALIALGAFGIWHAGYDSGHKAGVGTCATP
jgi:hypothetical protein